MISTKKMMALSLGLFLILVLPVIATGSFAISDHSDGSPNTNLSSAHQHLQPLTLSLQGGVTDAGTQQYRTRGGQLLSATILGSTVDISSASFQYSYQASVSGLSTHGFSRLYLSGTTTDGQHVSVVARGVIGDMVPGVYLPYGCTLGVNCTSEIPAGFIGESLVSINIGSYSYVYTTPVMFESAYLNPWGGPVVLASLDGSVVIVATYSSATIDWHNVQVSGIASGTLGSQPVSGNFVMSVNSQENLLTGTETDRGSFALVGMSNPILDASGRIQGTSVIPTAGAYDCSQAMGLPSDTCTMTGLTSSGRVSLASGPNVLIRGTYTTIWDNPAIGFTSTVVALQSK